MKTSWLVTAVVIAGLTFFGLLGAAAYFLWPQPSTLHHDLASLRWKLNRPLTRINPQNVDLHWTMVLEVGPPRHRQSLDQQVILSRIHLQMATFIARRAEGNTAEAEQFRRSLLMSLDLALKEFP